MEEQLVSFEVAKLAKEKGFQEPTHSLYLDKDLVESYVEGEDVEYYYISAGELKDNWNSNWSYSRDLSKCFGCKVDNEKYFEATSAPTQSLLQKWLREGHELIITINFETIDDSEKAYTYTIYEWLPEGKNSCKDIWDFYEVYNSMTQSSGWFPTHEEALEEALKESLKLIK